MPHASQTKVGEHSRFLSQDSGDFEARHDVHRPKLALVLCEAHLLHLFLWGLVADPDAAFNCRVNIRRDINLQESGTLAHELHHLAP